MASPTRGRSMRPDDQNANPPPRADGPAQPPAPPGDGRPSPFATFGPGAGSMGEMAEENRSQSLGILAIVAGLGVSVAAIVMLMMLVLVLWLLYSAATGDSPLAGKKPTKDQHVRDTGFATPELPAPGQTGTGPRRGSTDPADPNYRDPSLGPPPGPASVIVSKDMMFLSIEVNCPGGYRSRGDFRKDGKNKKATVQNVPGDERCTVTFQGSRPAKGWITGNQTLSCTFDPVVCSPVY